MVARVLCCSLVSKYLLFSFQPANRVFSHKLCVVVRSDWLTFGVLQSRVHEAWAKDLSSSLGNTLQYTPSRCFETFPFPRPTPAQQSRLTQSGEALYRARTAAQRQFKLGLTKLWNRVEDPSDDDPLLQTLRQYRSELDHATLAAYGWESGLDAKEIVKRLRALNTKR